MRKFTEGIMVVKLIARVTYWLGIVCMVLALALRVFNAMGFEFLHVVTKGNTIDFRSFLDATLLFLFASMASSLYARLDT
jgi:hypothetical protein